MKKSPLFDRRRGVLLSFCLLAFVGTCSCRQKSKTVEAPWQAAPVARQRAAGEPEIRVAVLKDAADLRIGSSGGSARVFNADGVEVRRVAPGAVLQIAAAGTGFVLDA